MSSRAIAPTVYENEVTFGHLALRKLERILLCSDFSKASESATAEAIDLCRRMGASLCVLHVDEYGESVPPSQCDAISFQERRQLEAQRMQSTVERIRNEGIVKVDALTVTGHPPVTIVEMIARYRPDLAIVGTSGIHGFERMIFGSTAEAVFRHATCPVLIAGPKVSSKRQKGNGPVVFATDFHEPAKDAVRYACTLARAKGAPLHCIHVLPLTAENERQHTVLTSIMKEALCRLSKDMESDSCGISHDILFDSEISHAVVRYAEMQNAECLVLGVHRGLLLSSHLPPHLTYRMIATAPCPVLTISREAVRAASEDARRVCDA